MKPTTVRVTAEHIARGTPCNSCECPIALAVPEALAAQGVRVRNVYVDGYDAYVEVDGADGPKRFNANLGLAGHDFILAFDLPVDHAHRAEGIAPFEMELTWREGNR